MSTTESVSLEHRAALAALAVNRGQLQKAELALAVCNPRYRSRITRLAISFALAAAELERIVGKGARA